MNIGNSFTGIDIVSERFSNVDNSSRVKLVLLSFVFRVISMRAALVKRSFARIRAFSFISGAIVSHTT